MRLPVIAVCLVFAAGCGDDSTVIIGPGVPLNQQFTLTVGQSANVRDARLAVQFTGVSGDSRCPADAVCILGGDALVHVRIVMGQVADYELHTGDASQSSVTVGGFRIALVDLQPFPFSGRTISQNEYRATFAVAPL